MRSLQKKWLWVALLLIVVVAFGKGYLGRKGMAKASTQLVNGKEITCVSDAYNCPSYSGPYQSKRLKNCEDVRLVWETCSGDPHDLDREGDGLPCEVDGC